LSEYVWHVAKSLSSNPRIEHVHVLADRGEESESPDLDRVSVHQCWSFSGVDKPLAVTRLARRLAVDAVWFHMHMTSGGNTRLSQFASLASPAVSRAAGIPTIVTLHNMLGLTEVKYAYPTAGRLDVLGGHAATALLRFADEVCVPLPQYSELMRSRYGIQARFMPLGTPGSSITAVPPSFGGPQTLLAFGRFGSYKRLEVVLEAVDAMHKEGINLRLVIAGSDSRRTPGYIAKTLDRYRHIHNVEYAGYVRERDVQSLFERATVCVLPYATVTGMSSVITQAAMYGVPIVASDVPGMRLFEKLGLRINFFDWPVAASLCRAIHGVFASPALSRDDAVHNLAYCRARSMDDVVNRYVGLIAGAVDARSSRDCQRDGAISMASRLK